MLGDMANPQRDLPIVITSAMLTIITGFSMMNAAIYVVLPFETIRASTTVAVVRPHTTFHMQPTHLPGHLRL